ncbi:MAG: ABC transporter permease [Anaerolineae bacterium]|nr:ABC transporter permease [Anaerolineae bacterium]
MNNEMSLPNGPKPAHFYKNTAWRLVASLIWIGVLFGLTAILAIIVVSAGNFNLKGLMPNLLMIGLMAPAMVMIVGAGGLDLSVGSVVALIGVIVALMMQDGSPVMAIILGLGIALLIGLINGVLVGLARIPGVLITLAMLALARGLAFMLTEGYPVQLGRTDSSIFNFLPVLGWILFAVVGIGGILLVQLTPFGRRPAPGQPEQAESWLKRAIFVGGPYLLSSFMAGFAGILLLQRLRIGTPTVGLNLEINVILAVIIGGTCLGGRFGTVIGGLVGAAFVALWQYFLTVNGVNPYLQQFASGVLLLAGGILIFGYYALVGLVYRNRVKIKANDK